MYDVAIIGAGLAGATLARLIAGAGRTLLVESRNLSGADGKESQGKCCGGLLAPDGQRMLATLGLGLPKRVLLEPQVFVVRATDLATGAERYYQRHYINMDRAAFDRWLVSLVPTSVELRNGCRLESCEREGDAFTLVLRAGKSETVERARLVIGADGAHSRARRRFGLGIGARRYLAIQDWFEADSTPPYFSAFFYPEVTDYYGWMIPKGDSVVVGAAIPFEARDPHMDDSAADCTVHFELLLRKLAERGYEMGTRLRRESCLLLRPMRTGHLCLGTEGVGLIGEAAGWISPSSAEGFSYAFRSALAAADALRDGPSGFLRRYRRRSAALRLNIALKGAKSRVIYGRLLRRAVMRNGLGSVTVIGSGASQ